MRTVKLTTEEYEFKTKNKKSIISSSNQQSTLAKGYFQFLQRFPFQLIIRKVKKKKSGGI